ncbi:MAG: tRNA uridine-5-carboxymethylaminomethyl(34) synthesis GTPase MnmE [Verrucomicrobia bacterium GWF2_51_19]|nr:MAG: tRNA uridine-5-carboxymethylaminomethyl(34) synthesis GTPase MnmE [Verrucomicrobia bacterium GWF2_51_19]HAD82595.1 tRNA uridine-5-carboxymethylaminomethyl(34) synthesis GTPase MnmE [Candidatus Edwardsbacteria bacterium]
MPYDHPGASFCALSTPPGESAIGVIRANGPLAEALAVSLAKVPYPTPRHAYFCDYVAVDGKVLDVIILTYFEAGKSYTGDALVELACHGNPLILQKVLEDLFKRGFRLAEPGEFTRTAFLNGKMDLCQAEAVAELIHARSEKALHIAERQLKGGISAHYHSILDALMAAIAHLEAYIDFPEEDLPSEDAQGPLRDIAFCLSKVKKMLATRHYSALLHEGVKTVIFGAPNAGKSSLLNAFLGEDRALVSPEPGTTRDFLAERILVGPHALRIIDTAGLHTPTSKIERCGIEKTFLKIDEADLCLFVVDATRPYPAFDAALWAALAHKHVLLVLNKTDLMPPPYPTAAPWNALPCLPISAKTGDGIDALKRAILDAVEAEDLSEDEDLIICIRHARALEQAETALADAFAKLKDGAPVELAVCDLRFALDCIGGILGKVDNEVILGLIFSKFCIGK